MTYREALREAFVRLLLIWRRVPEAAGEVWRRFNGFAYDLIVLVVALIGPALALLSPLLAFLVLADDRKRARARAEARRKIDEQYGHMRQKADN